MAGAAVGTGLAEAVRVSDGCALGLRVPGGLALALRVPDGLVLGVLTVPVGLGEPPDDVVAPGDRFGVAGGDVVQAATDAEATMAANPAAASLTMNPGPEKAERIVMDSSHPRRMAGGRQVPGSDGDKQKTSAYRRFDVLSGHTMACLSLNH